MRLLFWSILYLTTAMLILPFKLRSAAGTRAKRVVAFRKGSTFFYRMNYKINSISTTTIFAQASGFKVAWQLPDGSTEKRNRRSVDEIHESVELVYESHGFDGKACLAKNICQALKYAEETDGVMAKILKLLAKNTNDNETKGFDPLACKDHSLRCPLDLVDVNSFVDYR